MNAFEKKYTQRKKIQDALLLGGIIGLYIYLFIVLYIYNGETGFSYLLLNLIVTTFAFIVVFALFLLVYFLVCSLLELIENKLPFLHSITRFLSFSEAFGETYDLRDLHTYKNFNFQLFNNIGSEYKVQFKSYEMLQAYGDYLITNHSQVLSKITILTESNELSSIKQQAILSKLEELINISFMGFLKDLTSDLSCETLSLMDIEFYLSKSVVKDKFNFYDSFKLLDFKDSVSFYVSNHLELVNDCKTLDSFIQKIARKKLDAYNKELWSEESKKREAERKLQQEKEELDTFLSDSALD